MILLKAPNNVINYKKYEQFFCLTYLVCLGKEFMKQGSFNDFTRVIKIYSSRCPQ